MTIPAYRHALIVGAGSGLSASFARRLAKENIGVSLAARQTADLAGLCEEIDAVAYSCDVAVRSSIEALFAAVEKDRGAPDVVLFNPSARSPGQLIDLELDAVEAAIRITSLGGLFVAQEAGKRMVPAGHGAILFTGATASVKAYAGSTAFAMGKFALRALAQSLARELHPQGIHIGHFIIDGGIRNPARLGREGDPSKPDALLEPDAIAEAYWQHLRQDRSCWSWEVEVRPWVERF